MTEPTVPATPSEEQPPKTGARVFLDNIANLRRSAEKVAVQCQAAQKTLMAQQQFPVLTAVAQVQDLATILATTIDSLGVMAEQVIRLSTVAQRAGLLPPPPGPAKRADA